METIVFLYLSCSYVGRQKAHSLISPALLGPLTNPKNAKKALIPRFFAVILSLYNTEMLRCVRRIVDCETSRFH